MRSPLDFSELLAERTRQFTGRDWVFAAIDMWVRDPNGARTFLLTGAPGTGKTATAARLAQASEGVIALDGPPPLFRGTLAYAHFCQAGRDSTLSPTTFVQSLSEALATRFSPFCIALQKAAGRHIAITSNITVTGPVEAGARVVGTSIGAISIESRGGEARQFFDEAVRRPLQTLNPEPGTPPIVVLVDALDEALAFANGGSIVHLLARVDDFPPHVRFLLTCRSNSPRVFDLVGEPTLDLVTGDPAPTRDIQAYAFARLAAGPMGDQRRDELAARVAHKSAGNFLYARHVLTRALHTDSWDSIVSRELPATLDDVYETFLERELTADRKLWGGFYRPLLGALAVARGDGLTRRQLARIVEQPLDRVDDALDLCKEYLVGGTSRDEPHRLYHHSFREFLLNDGRFGVYPAERHAAIAAFLLRDPLENDDAAYGLASLPYHLAMAGDYEGLRTSLTPVFLEQKASRLGFAVLEDVELLARAMLERAEPSAVETCVTLIADLRKSVGDALHAEIVQSMFPSRGASTFAAPDVKAIETSSIPGFDIAAVVVPKGAIAADFVQILPIDDGVFIAIGDAPGYGLKSAFVARFLAAQCEALVKTIRPLDLGQVFARVSREIAGAPFFERVSMQAVKVSPAAGIMEICSAGHPYPVLYEAERRACIRLPVRGRLLRDIDSETNGAPVYAARRAEIAPGDVLVLLSDGLVEAARLDKGAYGYRFTEIVERHATATAQTLCDMLLHSWRAHPKTPDFIDDLAIVVLKVAYADR